MASEESPIKLILNVIAACVIPYAVMAVVSMIFSSPTIVFGCGLVVAIGLAVWILYRMAKK